MFKIRYNLFGRKLNLLLIIFLGLSAIVRSWGINFGLPHTLARPDENVVITTALKFGTGDLNPHFFIYPTFYMYMLFFVYILYFIGGKILGKYSTASDFAQEYFIDPTNFYLISRCISALFGTASILLIYQIAEVTYNKRVAYISSLFLALAYLHVRDSHFGVTDVTTTFFILFSTLFIVKTIQSPKIINYGLAGVFAGLAMSTKYMGVMLLPSMYLAHFFTIKGEGFHKLIFDKRILLFFLYFVMAFGLTSPFVILSLPEFISDFINVTHLVNSNSNIAGDFFDKGWFYHLRYTLFHGLGGTLLFASLLGIFCSFKIAPKKTVILYSFPFIYYLIAGSGHTTYHRYMVPVVPFFCLAGAHFVDFIANKIKNFVKEKIQVRARGTESYIALVIVVLTILPSTHNIIHLNGLLAQKDNRLVATDWVYQNIPKGSSLYHVGSEFEKLQLNRTIEYLQREYNFIQENNLHLPRVENRIKEQINFYKEQPNISGYEEYFLDKDNNKFYKHYLQELSSKTVSFFGKKYAAFFDETSEIPEYIILYKSHKSIIPPLEVVALINNSYQLKNKFEAINLSDKRNYFDNLDAFYLPFSGFKNVKRPGPNIYIYERIKN